MLPNPQMIQAAADAVATSPVRAVHQDADRIAEVALTFAFRALDRDALIEAAIEAVPSHGPGGFGRYSPSHRRGIAEAVLRAVGLLPRVRAR